MGRAQERMTGGKGSAPVGTGDGGRQQIVLGGASMATSSPVGSERPLEVLGGL